MSDIPEWMLAVGAQDIASLESQRQQECQAQKARKIAHDAYIAKAKVHGQGAQLKADKMIKDFMALRGNWASRKLRLPGLGYQETWVWDLDTGIYYLSDKGEILMPQYSNRGVREGIKHGWDPKIYENVLPSWMDGPQHPGCGICGPGEPRFTGVSNEDPHHLLLSRVLMTYVLTLKLI